jgi:hypothetical protein
MARTSTATGWRTATTAWRGTWRSRRRLRPNYKTRANKTHQCCPKSSSSPLGGRPSSMLRQPPLRPHPLGPLPAHNCPVCERRPPTFLLALPTFTSETWYVPTLLSSLCPLMTASTVALWVVYPTAIAKNELEAVLVRSRRITHHPHPRCLCLSAFLPLSSSQGLDANRSDTRGKRELAANAMNLAADTNAFLSSRQHASPQASSLQPGPHPGTGAHGGTHIYVFE